MDVKSLVKKWIDPKDIKSKSDYEEEKRKFEMAIGKPFIILQIEIPTGFEKLGNEFRKLESDRQFHEEVKDLVRKRLMFNEQQKTS